MKAVKILLVLQLKFSSWIIGSGEWCCQGCPRVRLMDLAEARIVDLGCVCVMMMAMVRKGRVDDPKMYLCKLRVDDPDFVLFCV